MLNLRETPIFEDGIKVLVKTKTIDRIIEEVI